MELEFDVKINAAVLYDYMLHHTFLSPAGLIGTSVGALLICSFFMGLGVIYFIFGCVLLLYLPGSLWLKSRQQAMMNPAFQKPLHYRVTQEGVTVSQEETEAETAWDTMYKAVSTRNSIILYTSKVNAFIFPRKDAGSQLYPLIEMISTHMPPAKVKIRA